MSVLRAEAQNKIVLIGRVLPETSRATLKPRAFTWQMMNGGWVDFRFIVHDAKVQIECHLLDDAARSIPWQAIGAKGEGLVQAMLDLMAFSTGTRLEFYIDTLAIDDGEPQSIQRGDPSGANYCTAYTLASIESFEAILNAVLPWPPVFLALRDLQTSIDSGSFATVYHQRAIDGLRNFLAGKDNTLSESKKWELFRDTMRVDREYLDAITDHAHKRRHADHTSVPPEVALRSFDHAWTIMNRFMVYLMRGRQPLAEDEFPLLKD